MADENKDVQEEGVENTETIQGALGETEMFFEKNKAMINKVLIGVIVVLGGYVLMKKMVWEPTEVESQEELWSAQYIFEKDSFAAATEMFQDIVDNYGSTDAGNVSNLYLGISLMKQGDFESAMDPLSSFDGDGYFMPSIATGLLGDCHSETDNADEAISLYKKAATSADSKVYSPYYLKKAALLLEQNGESDKAVKLYQKILDKYYYEDIREFSEERKSIVKNLERAKSAS